MKFISNVAQSLSAKSKQLIISKAPVKQIATAIPTKQVVASVSNGQIASSMPTHGIIPINNNVSVHDAAKGLRKSMVACVDWTKGLPKDNEEGSFVLKKTISPYIEYVKGLSQEDAEKFSRFAIGKHQAKVIVESASTNKDVRMFKNALETKLGRNLDTIV